MMKSNLNPFIPIKAEDLNAALKSGITSKNNFEFNNLLKDWIQGDYDEDPGLLRDRLIALL